MEKAVKGSSRAASYIRKRTLTLSVLGRDESLERRQARCGQG